MCPLLRKADLNIISKRYKLTNTHIPVLYTLKQAVYVADPDPGSAAFLTPAPYPGSGIEKFRYRIQDEFRILFWGILASDFGVKNT